MLHAALFGFHPTNSLFDRLHLDKDASGAAHLKVLGDELLIRPDADGKSAVIEVAAPLTEAKPN